MLVRKRFSARKVRFHTPVLCRCDGTRVLNLSVSSTNRENLHYFIINRE